MQAKHIGEYLISDSGTSRLVPQAALLLAIRRQLSVVLPDHLCRSCTIANYKQGVVILFAESNAAAAKLRFLAPRLIEALGKHGLKVTGIKVEVQAKSSFAVQATEKKARSLSSPAAAALGGLCGKLPDGRLKRAVETLAKKGR